MASSFPFKFRVFSQFGGLLSILDFDANISTIEDEFVPTWDTYPDQGRADMKFRYNTFSRVIFVKFAIVVKGTDGDVNVAFDDLNDFSKVVYPTYRSGRGYVGNYLEFTIGGLYYREYGVVSRLKYSWDNTNLSWDTKYSLPMYGDVDLQITYIGKKLPSTNHATAFAKRGERKGGDNPVA